MTNEDIAGLLLAAHGGGPPARIEIADAAQAYTVQRLIMARLGEIGGWKVGADGPDAPPSCAPMPATHLVPAPHVFDSARFQQREVESEICFTFGAGLPPRDTPYQAAEILGAIATCQPGIEILQSRLAEPHAVSRLALLADFIQHGAFAWGAPIATWREIDFAALPIRQTISGTPPIERVGNPAGDMRRLLLWLANEGAVWAGGIKPGQIVTCGSWTGKARAQAGSEASAAFAGAPVVRIGFSAD